MKTSPLSTPPTALRSSPARFSHLHPRVSTAMGFLESCAEVGPDVPPVLSALLRPPDGGVVGGRQMRVESFCPLPVSIFR